MKRLNLVNVLAFFCLVLAITYLLVIFQFIDYYVGYKTLTIIKAIILLIIGFIFTVIFLNNKQEKGDDENNENEMESHS
ncbi:MAG: hypothetical protein WBO70_01965 [Erysipelotrichaceae bacterium]